MATTTLSVSVSGSGEQISRSILRTTDGGSSRTIPLPMGKAGTLTTRTDNNTGTITMSSGGHGITTGMNVDVYWSGGVQYNVTVGTVSGTSVPIDLGVGDNLPIATTAVVVTPRVVVNADIDGDAVALIGIECGYADPTSTDKAHLHFVDVSVATIAEVDFSANTPQVWDITGGSANPFTGNPITKIYASNGSSTADATLKVIWGVDSTP